MGIELTDELINDVVNDEHRQALLDERQRRRDLNAGKICVQCGEAMEPIQSKPGEGTAVPLCSPACQQLFGRWTITSALIDGKVRCHDCGKLYSEFALDVILPDEQWALLTGRSDGGGILCAGCIVARAGKIPGVTVAKMVLE